MSRFRSNKGRWDDPAATAHFRASGGPLPARFTGVGVGLTDDADETLFTHL